jgi:hypothetical protein
MTYVEMTAPLFLIRWSSERSVPGGGSPNGLEDIVANNQPCLKHNLDRAGNGLWGFITLDQYNCSVVDPATGNPPVSSIKDVHRLARLFLRQYPPPAWGPPLSLELSTIY